MPQPMLRRDLALANTNAIIWAVGNGLVSTTLIRYLAQELGAQGLAVGFILAAPRFAGVLRLGLPAALARFRRRKAMCIAFYVASALLLTSLVAIALGGLLNTVWVLVAGWCAYHVIEYCGTVLLWSWLGDLMPYRMRGRLLGRREQWLMAGRVIGFGLSFGLVSLLQWLLPGEPRWVALAYSASLGAGCLAVATAPLLLMRSLESRPSAIPIATWRGVVHCFADAGYRRLLTFSSCFALANGLTAAAISQYEWRVLNISYPMILGLKSMTHGGQALAASAVGRWVDTFGAKGLMFVSQLVVATGPLFYWLATPDAPGWVAGAWVAWIAYVGLNVGLDHQKLSLAPPDNNVPALAAYHAISDLANGVMLVVGGVIYDRLTAEGADPAALCGPLFLCGWAARTAVAGLILRLKSRPAPLSSAEPRG